jgi:hypothetical protein
MAKEITELFDEFYNNVLGKVGTVSRESIQEEVDKFSDQFEKDLQNAIPHKNGGLLKSLTKVKVQKDKWYGYDFEFKGNNEHGVPYEKIATVLNYGRPEGISKDIKYGKIAPRKFMIKAIRKLKKLDPAINDNFESKMQKLNEKI